ncbi:KilA-N domain-containing protein [Gossypium arboreum]|uniref:KilA-N domain-containing protein n=1 Tax=Gossypium arboreum TaxID=29729 RepID=A0A0B0N6G3_GOSAR|nr:KilA-N domain-containing protein [Gossypium arboreum]
MYWTSISYWIRVRPCLRQWHRYEIACKTTFGTLALFDICDYPSILFNSKWFNGQYQVKIKCDIELKCQLCAKLVDLKDKILESIYELRDRQQSLSHYRLYSVFL